ncbi:MAG: DUF3386 domain-containing protein [Cyanobacteria bacterium]|nr:DUF3386 domain-containing protein [Cyanobacteria bacterium CG_2015-16_32_12]NCO78234.1 DUF3386 domain-containing protein [Cyanobacteria bacterium CG_2015-22_32_23]NCQ03275.1 DUF3386 domain-containing protein [Cyanobacteria bacterium CG_2015-09_32_10]NCQ41960.1 DUF3386 domain-containing protein [Cyanobacteria bacterium CG_2015-04_32_10]NCS85708.1 DUF3386 domain-containing protein [Cyanobacteria bacterium CG_2015-02_32_10]
MTLTLTAEELFKSAYENRYTWDKNFPGYTCDITLTNPQGSYTAKGEIKASLQFEVSGIEDETAKKAITSQLWEITIHRVNHSFEKSHGENTFTFGEKDENGAIEILVGGAGEGNQYKVNNNVVSFVYRKIGNSIVAINTFGVLNTDEGYLSEGYDSIYLDPESKQPKGGKTVFQDTFEKINGYYILTHRTITSEENGQPTVTEYKFTNIVFG